VSDPSTSYPERASRRRVVLGAVAALVLVALVVLGITLRGGANASPTAAATSSSPSATAAVSSAPSSGEPAPTPTPAPAPTSASAPDVVDENAAPPVLPAVGLDETAAVGDGVTASIAALDAITGKATGPGNVDGPALRATVRITNGTAGPINLDTVSVAMAYGTYFAAASPLGDPSATEFAGDLAAGRSAEASFVFSVPENGRDLVSVTVGYRAGAPVLEFTGSAV
jgi:cytoskeletal protein RodZ